MGNAVKADSWFPRFEVCRTTDGGPPLMMKFPLAASQTIVKGDPLTISNGDLSLATTSSGAIFGVAAEDAVTTASDEATEINVWVADRRNIFRAQGYGAATAAIYPGAAYDIYTASGAWKLNFGSQTESVAMIVDWVEGDSRSDTTDIGRMEFVWKRSQYDALVAAL
jgi:hypothetical protein